MAKKRRQKVKPAENGVQLPKAGAVVATSRSKKPKVQELWENYFGEGALSDWQRLCGDLALPDDLPSKRQCRIALRRVNVNIRQFLEASSRPEGVRFFKNTRELEMFTRERDYFYPRKKIPKGSPLRALLRCLA
ncbi:unnamed protein product [Parascedosporium putredinis]|uniref:Uncharacterized protein n=1 Tax=Parascedosporium putredinis TaxID=1442378 RepID=A0A9P1MCC1_9PEZI|nr:unnamed protein product [Parascedosporium putredinis]CAI7998109.1 unnamed protein product [Parascedosporium putredinis]